MQTRTRTLLPKIKGSVKTKSTKMSWEVIILIGAIGCILMTTYRYLDPTHGGAVLTYLLYPLSIFSVALLVYTRNFIKYQEIRLFGVFFLWVFIVIALNYQRASNAISSGWFHSLVSISILCFSLPYALSDISTKTAMRILAGTTIFLTTITGIIALTLVLMGNSIDLRPAIEGVLGMNDEGRLEFFNHANIAASECGLSILLSISLFVETKKRLVKYLLVFVILICYLSLALTDSRTGIIATAFAIGFITFLLCGTRLRVIKSKRTSIILSIFISLCFVAIFYTGTKGLKSAYNMYIEYRTSTIQSADGTIIEPSSSEFTSEEPEDAIGQASSRGLSDASTFNGRTLIWKGTIRGLRDHPEILLTGTTPLLSGEILTSYISILEPMKNFHNSFLAVLVGLGLPGFVLFALFMLKLCVICVRMIVKHRSITSNESLLMLTPIVLFSTLYGMMEQLIIVDSMPNLVWVWLMLASGNLMKSTHIEVECFSGN